MNSVISVLRVGMDNYIRERERLIEWCLVAWTAPFPLLFLK